MKQALKQLAAFCEREGVRLVVNPDGSFDMLQDGAEVRQASLDWLCERLHGLRNPAQPEAAAQAAMRALTAMGYEWDSFVGYWAPPLGQQGAPLPEAKVLAAAGYDELADVLHRAFHQAAHGKGKERHANGEPFVEQVMQDGARRFGTGALLFQAFKKSEESQRLPLERAVNELLGGIVYLAGAVIAEERKHAKRDVAANDSAISAQRHA